MAFSCNACGLDLSVRMDLLALAVKSDYPEDEYPEDLSLDGLCDNCGAPFNYGGEFFANYMRLKIEEGVISPETRNYAIIAFDVTDEEHTEFKRLTKLGDKKKLSAFLRRLQRDKD